MRDRKRQAWRRRLAVVLSSAWLTLNGLAPVALAAGPPVVRARSLAGSIRLDGVLDEAAWRQAGVIEDLVQQEPHPGETTPFVTEVRVLVDATTIYIGVACHDPDPSQIAIHTMQRDGGMRGDDTISIVFDPAGDGRRGYFFEVNAVGARLDGLISGPEEMSTDWDGIWDAATQRTAGGWSAEILIPAQTLRFRWGQERWGFNVQRYVARDRTTLRWSGLTLDAGFTDLQRAGQISGVGTLRQGLGLSLSPYGLIQSAKDFEKGEEAVTGEAGGDLTWNFTGDLTGYLTLNPDFAETEIDTRQVNLTRFALFFPEKRTFFLEGSDIFEFGSGLGRDFVPFFSRRIGLFSGEKVPLLGGGKLLGRAGKWTVAALAVAADRTSATQRTNLFAGRVTYDVDDHLTVGAIATDGDPEGARDNSLGGLDLLWRTSTFGRGKNKNFSLGGWAAASRGDLPEGPRSGWGFTVDYPNDLWDLALVLKEFGSGFDPALGFLPRPGTRWYEGNLEYSPRPKKGLFSWVRQFFFELRPRLIQDADGRTESWRVFTAPFNARTQSGEHLEANVMPQFERLDEPFEIAEDVVIPPGDYNYTRFRVEAQSSRHRPWRVGATVWFGDFFTGSLTQTEAFVTYTTPSGHLQLEFNAESDRGKLPEGDFTLNLGQIKAVYAFTPDSILSSFIQYDSESRDLGANTRYRWTLTPGSDLFVVWFHGWRNGLNGDRSRSLRSVSDQVAVKLRWTFRR